MESLPGLMPGISITRGAVITVTTASVSSRGGPSDLIGDVSENISQVNWTVYGKIGNIQKKQAFLGYVYNAGGERVVKQYLPYATNQCLGCDENTGMVDLEVYERNSNTPNVYKASKTITFLSEYTDVRYNEYTAIIEAGLALCTPQCNVQPPLNTSDADIYIRDATGNVLAVYHYDRKTAQLRWSEQHLYGSSRLGMYQPEKVVTSVSTDSKQREVGYWGKQVFELSNHLGNVLATISDKKLQVSTNTTSNDYFEAEVQTVQDYYAFGMQMPGRKMSGGYRYGFNGKENDNEVKGEGNQQDYGMRIYDGRIGKFLSVDPLTSKFPFYTPYQFSSNSPISSIDLDGLESVIIIRGYNSDKINTKLQNVTAEFVSKSARETKLTTNLINWLVPQLKIPETRGTNLSTAEKAQVISETVRDYLSFNFTESINKNIDGSSNRNLFVTADLNYKLIFGDKSGEMTEKVKLAFDVLIPAFEKYQDATKLTPHWLNITVGAADYGLQALDEKYADMTLQAIGQVSDKLIEKGVEEAVLRGLINNSATVIAPRLLGTFANVFTNPLSAGGPTTTETNAAKKASEERQLKKNTIGSLLFYFMNNNQLNLKVDLEKQKPLSDHPEDSQYKKGGKNE
jgi:RHS repeat-associated protein